MKPVALIIAFALGLGLGALGATSRFAAGSADAGDSPAAMAAAPFRSAATGSNSEPGCPDEAQLRRVVREELAAAAAAGTVAQDGRTPAPAPAAGLPAPLSSPEQVALVNRQLDEYIRAGAISDSEMVRLQSAIATLDPVARRAAMQKLVRALNSGTLDGRL